MAIPSSDAFVFFGATGDLAYKKIFPALQALIRRGDLDMPIIGVARAGWTLDQLRERARDSLEAQRRRRCGRVRQAVGAAAVRRRRLPRSRDLRPPEAGAGRRRAPAALSRDSAEHVRHRGAGPGEGRLRQGCAGRRREAVRPRPRLGAGAQPHAARGLPGVGDVPHRPLSRQGGGAEPALFPLRQRVPRADLEPQLRRERADHHGRELRRAGPRRLLRGGRRDPRRGAEPSAASDGAAGDGRAGRPRSGCDARREAAAVPRDAAAGSEAGRARPVPRLSRRSGRGAGFAGRDLRRAVPAHRHLALGRRAVLHPRRQVPADHRHRGGGRSQTPAAGDLR